MSLSRVQWIVVLGLLAGACGSSKNSASSSATLMVGASIRDITPTAGMLPLTRAPAVTMTGVLDPLHLRVLALSSGKGTVLMITTETGRSLGPQYARVAAEHAGIPIEAVFLAATHSHAAPEITTNTVDLDFEAGTTPTNQQLWSKYAQDQMLAAIDEALANMKPAKVGIGYSESYINVSRSELYNKINADGSVSQYYNLGYNPSLPSDKTVAAIQFNDLSGAPLAFIVNYAVHGTVMHANTCMNGSTGISSDIPGALSTHLETKYPGAVALWLSGAAGDQNPVVQNDVYSRNPVTGEFVETFTCNPDELTYLSGLHNADVDTALATIKSFASVPVNFDFGKTDVPATAGGTVTFSLQLVRLGDIALVGFPGEAYTLTGSYIKDNSTLKNTIFVNHAWQQSFQNNGYCADDVSIQNGYYNASRAKYKTGYINESLSSLLNSMISETSEWTFNGDGTATNQAGKSVIVGQDGRPGTEDDNQIVNPAGTVLFQGVTLSRDSNGRPYVALGNGFNVSAGPDGKLGTTDDIIEGFGTYPQSDVTGAKSDPLSWRPVALEGDQLTMVASVLVDSVQFNLVAGAGNAWATSNIRAWMNSAGGQNSAGDTTGFYNKAFSGADKSKLVQATVPMNSGSSFVAYNRLLASDNWQTYSTTGTDTQDYVWALSGEEVWTYFGASAIATQAELGWPPSNYTNAYYVPSAWANAQGVKINTGGNGPSFVGFGDAWTRSPGAPTDGTSYYGVFLGSTGSLNSGRPVNTKYGALPVVRVTLSQ